ncbi:MAG: hypothetical protein O9972_39635 [Burkholderiales bacterium]|nr:hypothetical protein [Burkholderiales bacterium]
MSAPLFSISTQKVGGLRFVRVGRLCLSFCLTRKPAPKAEPAQPGPRFYVRPVIEGEAGMTKAGIRLYRNGKLCAVRWCADAFAHPGEAWAHAQAAARRSGFTIAR